ncbi:hypothetical protein BH10CHL1_BH10CHL1_42690 [soil metagenome]
MKIVIDMNLSPQWSEVFKQQGWSAVHWSNIGAPDALDTTIMDWARTHNHLVFTHDLDFGTALALTRENGPSVIQVRTEDVMPESLGNIVIQVIERYKRELNEGALITVDERKARVRILPI